MKKLFLWMFASVLMLSCNSSGKETPDGSGWITMDEAVELAEKGTDKKFLVDVYTDWCGWCKVMDKKTFTDPALTAYLKEHFHLVKFNAEQREPIVFKGRTFEWQDMGRNGVHGLAVELLQGQMAYPSLVYLDPTLTTIRVSPGFKDASQLQTEVSSL
jgi:thioredoxin-related protein